MRALISQVFFAAIAASACAQTQPASVMQKPPAAVSAQRFAVPAVEATHMPPHGYSAEARRVADCLATYPSYDHRTDRIEVSPGESRRCPL